MVVVPMNACCANNGRIAMNANHANERMLTAYLLGQLPYANRTNAHTHSYTRLPCQRMLTMLTTYACHVNNVINHANNARLPCEQHDYMPAHAYCANNTLTVSYTLHCEQHTYA